MSHQIIIYFHRRLLRVYLYRLATALYLLVIVLFGWFWSQVASQSSVPEIASEINRLYQWQNIRFSGRIFQSGLSSSGNRVLDIAADTIWVDGSVITPLGFNIRAYADADNSNKKSPSVFQVGSYLKTAATIYPLEKRRNPHDFDYKAYLSEKEIYLHGGIDKILRMTENRGLNWFSFKNNIIDLIQHNFNGQTAPLARALLLGDKRELTPEDRRQFSRSGLSHIMAVSGLHVGFLIVPFWIVIPWFWQYRPGKFIAFGILVILLYLYAGITGFSASVTRASLMALLLAFAKLWHKASDSLNLMGAAALILLVFDPRSIFRVGFQLSFAAVTVILLVWPILEKSLPAWVRYRWFGKPFAVMGISALVQIGLFPILTYYFGEFSIAGPVINAIVIPFLGIVIIWAIVALGVSAVAPAIGNLINEPAEWFLQALSRLTEVVGNLSWSWIAVSHQNGFLFVIWFFAIAFIAAWHIPQIRWKWLIGFLFVLVVYNGTKLADKLNRDPMRITYFDVGQGDAALIKTPGDAHILIDTGAWQPDYSSGKATIVPHLQAEGVEHLDAVFLSHPHADHIGGIEAVIDYAAIDTIYNAGMPYDSEIYRRYLLKAANRKIPVVEARAGKHFRWDDVTLLVYGPPEIKNNGDINDNSVILEVIHGENEFLFMGDAESNQEQRLLANYGKLVNTDVLKIGHHGSNTSSGKTFLDMATPKTAVVSVGWQNRYNHPHKTAVRRIKAYADTVFFTSRQGAIILESDSKKIRKVPWR